ncbi:hypothetical protein CDN99_27055 [Roseateles aquatilis]|uniref:CAAX protease n=1 Tax=Roseateles aquatilis TaxID=431061 RepID=A0A2D0ALW2_9BURK|nr:hypothetical protein CDN99_27055 [Roseateles aquatilis]
MLSSLSTARLAPYGAMFKPASDDAHLGSYLWAQALGASVHPFVGLVEVVLRNAIHRSLSLQSSGRGQETFPWYDRARTGGLALRGKSLERVEMLLSEGQPPVRKQPQPSPDAVVAALSFGFWPNLLEGLSNRWAPRTFTDVFAHHPHSRPQHWSHESNRRELVLRLKRLQQLRNRVCHFEPIWKPHWVTPGGAPVKHWSHTVAALRAFHADMYDLLAWCSPDAAASYRASFAWNWFNRLCTTHAVRAFMTKHATSAHLMPMTSQDVLLPAA